LSLEKNELKFKKYPRNVRLIYKEQVSKKTRRINTSGLFFCSLCGDELGDEFSDEFKFKINLKN